MDDGLIVALTSFPARIGFAWIAIESILRQSLQPDRIILVLCEKEFEGKRLPQSILDRTFRGVEILWVDENMSSYKKLLPVREKYPDATIITVDDDVVYRRWLVEALTSGHRSNPGKIIGMRGWAYAWGSDGLTPYRSWKRGNIGSSPQNIFLTGVGGVLYPPGVLDPNILLDYRVANRLCPTNDDIWFWAVAKVCSVEVICLGRRSHTPLVTFVEPEHSLNEVNVNGGANDSQLAKAITHFEISPHA